jgi:hypothetical protein
MWERKVTSRRCKDCDRPFRAKQAMYCEDCRSKRKGPPSPRKLWVWTPERDAIVTERYDSRVRGRADEIAKRLGFPKWSVKKRAAILGLSKPTTETRLPWTKTDEGILETWVGRRSLEQIQKRFFRNRTMTSIVMKIKHMKLSRRVERDGYTINELELALGHDHRLIHRWVREGRLKAKRVGAVHGESWIFTDADVLAFLKNNPSAFRLDRVDQLWFLDRVFGTRAVGSEAREQAAA